MKALILAAGFGSRLSPMTDNMPKAMVNVCGKPIIIKQIENLYENGIKNITVVAGYKSEMLISVLRKLYPDINIIRNIDYETTNNMYSAYIGRHELKGHDFLMMNADVFYDSSVLKELCSSKYENAIVTDIGNYSEESMKVLEKKGRITKISKTIGKDEAIGNSIDVYKFSSEAGTAFFDKCAEYIESRYELKLWSEVALNDILSYVKFTACPLVGRWYEIDNSDDLDNAERLFANE